MKNIQDVFVANLFSLNLLGDVVQSIKFLANQRHLTVSRIRVDEFLWVTMRCCFGAWLMNSEIDPLGWEKIQLKSTQEGNGNPGYNTGGVPIMISEYPWEIKCPQNRSSAWFLSNSIFLRVSPQLLLKMNWFGLQKRYSILLLLLLHQGAIKMSTL